MSTQLNVLNSQEKANQYLKDIRLTLLREKTWRYLRYLHLREGFLKAGDIKTVLAIGAGRAYAELALAIEFPHVNFFITDIKSKRTPNYQVARSLARKWGIKNIQFDILDILKDTNIRADLVTSVEVLEHIEDDVTAAQNMKIIANKYVFCLVPFGDVQSNSDPKFRARVWERFQHYRVGYDAHNLKELFGETSFIRGCYWANAGQKFRATLTALTPEEIEREQHKFYVEASRDIVESIPQEQAEAQGIWVLAPTEPTPLPDSATTPFLMKTSSSLISKLSSVFRLKHKK